MPPPALAAMAPAPFNASGASMVQTVYDHPPPPVLVGGLVALFLSGVVFMQVVLYFQMYQSDQTKTKLIILAVWLLDIAHSALVCTSNWQSLITEYGEFQMLDKIQWSISLTIALTAITTFIVHCFFIHRIWKLSRYNIYITIPLIALALLRVASALVTTAEMLRLGSYVIFIQDFTYIFTLGLAISASLDVLITTTLCYYLRKGRTGFVRFNHIVDTLTLYTVENGMLTCIATALSLFFWLFMRHNFAFLGMHLAINKPNRAQGSGDRYALPVMMANPPLSPRDFSRHDFATATKPLQVQVNVDVERTVQHDDVMDVTGGALPVEVDLGSMRKCDSDSLTDTHASR
ncbi:hypothetical protein C8Q80DRAFT_1265479 [Daedaleopsis nitida]|nr:hypothetical protein C8Q80DRAFT_1265479 [Daedaleopsis nitida]